MQDASSSLEPTNCALLVGLTYFCSALLGLVLLILLLIIIVIYVSFLNFNNVLLFQTFLVLGLFYFLYSDVFSHFIKNEFSLFNILDVLFYTLFDRFFFDFINSHRFDLFFKDLLPILSIIFFLGG